MSPSGKARQERPRSKDAVEYRRLYKTALWVKHLRPLILARDLYTCQKCGTGLTQGRTRDTDAVVNHKTPHRGDPDLFRDPDNLEAVCKRCHDTAIAKAEQGSGRTIGIDGWPTQPDYVTKYNMPYGIRHAVVPVHIVFGPPASGKTTYVKANAKPTDVIIDLDDIKERMFGVRYTTDFTKVKRALRERDAMIVALGDDRFAKLYTGAWLILTGPTPGEREAWQKAIGPLSTVHTIAERKDICIGRIMADPQRADVAKHQVQAVQRWR